MGKVKMIRGTWVRDPDNPARWIPKAQYMKGVKRQIEAARCRSDLPSPQIMRDIEPFKNVAVDGEVISSRSHKREMMKRHNLVEIGNEKRVTKRQDKRKPVKEAIKRSMQELGYA